MGKANTGKPGSKKGGVLSSLNDTRNRLKGGHPETHGKNLVSREGNQRFFEGTFGGGGLENEGGGEMTEGCTKKVTGLG